MSLPRRNLRRTLDHLRAFRVETTEPERLYTLMADDVITTVGSLVHLDGARVLDVGGGPGYVADAFAAAGARCVTVDPSLDELHLHGRSARHAVAADGQDLPFSDAAFDVVHCSNVLEHVRDPQRLLGELGRCSVPGGIVYLSFTNWYSPWGGHEISPWHYLGAERAVRRYERTGRRVKNVPGESLFRLGVGQVLGWLRHDERWQVVSLAPRYAPSWGRPIVRVPVVREVVTWNLEAVLRRTGQSAPAASHAGLTAST